MQLPNVGRVHNMIALYYNMEYVPSINYFGGTLNFLKDSLGEVEFIEII